MADPDKKVQDKAADQPEKDVGSKEAESKTEKPSSPDSKPTDAKPDSEEAKSDPEKTPEAPKAEAQAKDPKVDPPPADQKPEPEKTEDSKDAAKESDSEKPPENPPEKEENEGVEESEDSADKKPKKAKRFKLPFGRKSGDADKSKKESPEESEPITPEDAINQIDESINVHAVPPEAKLASKIDEQIFQAKKGDYITLKIPAKLLLAVLGLILILMWSIPIVKSLDLITGNNYLELILSKIRPGQSQSEDVDPQEKVVQKTPEASQSAVPIIRIKHIETTLDSAQEIQTLLKNLGYEETELKLETELSEDNEIISKPDQDALHQSLAKVLVDTYQISATPSAQLSADSDFDAVIILGSQVQSELIAN